MNSDIVRLLDAVSPFMFLVALGTAPISVVNWIRYVRKRKTLGTTCADFPVVSVSLFLVPLLVFMLITSVISEVALNQTRSYLLDVRNPTISANGEPVSNVTPVLVALRSITYVPSHHSHPTRHIWLDVNSAEGRVLSAE